MPPRRHDAPIIAAGRTGADLSFSRRQALWISLALVVATVVSYRSVLDCGFTNYDDDQYVYNNAHVLAGLTPASVRWAFTTTTLSNWHPLTWLSLELDDQLFGPKPTGYHAVNLACHCLNSVLLFLVLRRMTGAVWPSACVAAIFALHPLHVESVAWVSERKDVLAALFFMLSLGAYGRYTAAPSLRRYLLVCITFALGLLAKPMLVTTPCVLLLLDHWPLRRWRGNRWRWLAVEKLPWFALAGISCVVTYLVQRQGGAVRTAEQISLLKRLMNLPVAYVEYLIKTIWPARLAIYYPLPAQQPVARAIACGLLLVLGSAAAVVAGRKRPFVFVGWCWWLGMLVPVIGLVQVGGQAHADRYMYLPQIGLAIAVCFCTRDLAVSRGWSKFSIGVAAVGALVCCSLMTARQIGYWRDSETLWRHAVEVAGPNPVACNSLGTALSEQGRPGEAIAWFQKCLELSPDDERAHLNLAQALLRLGRHDESISQYRAALAINPAQAVAHFNLGVLLEARGDTDGAMHEYNLATRHDPQLWKPHLRLAALWARRQNRAEAERHFSEAARLNPALLSPPARAP